MIYEYPDGNDPLRQGDIFTGLPRMELSLQEVVLVANDGERVAKWEQIGEGSDQEISVIVPVRPVTAIVATQDCDAQRSRDITLCEVRRFQDVEQKCKNTTAAKSWKSIITQHARINQKWFYLPPDERAGFVEKMAVDFPVSLRIPREDLELLRASRRRSRLNMVAGEHFRERIAEFFRRYSYDEWYPLGQEEFAAYRSEYPETQPFPWQEPDDAQP